MKDESRETGAREGNLSSRTLSGLLWTGWGRLANAALQLVIVGILARLIAPSEFGVVSAALIIVGLSAILSHIGLGPALVQRRVLESRHLDTAFVVSVLLGGLLGAVLWTVAPFAASVVGIPAAAPVLRALAWTFPIQGFGLVSEALLRRDLEFRWLAKRDVITHAVGYGGVAVVLAIMGWGVWALVCGQLAQTALRTVMLLVAHPPRHRTWGEWRAFRDLMYFGGGFTVAKIANYAALQGDKLVVGSALGSSALGLYDRAYQLMAAPAHGLGLVLDNVLFPAMARVQDDSARLSAAYRRGVTVIAVAVLPWSMVALVTAPEIVRVLLGPQWTGAVGPFQVLALGMLFRTSYKMSDSLARSTGAVYRRAWRQLHYALLVAGGAWIGQYWGGSITGAAWGVLTAVTINFLSMGQLSLSVLGMTWSAFWRAHVPALLLTAAVLPPSWLAVEAARRAELPPIAILIATACVATAAGLLAAWRAPSTFIGADSIWILHRLAARLPARLTVRMRTAAGLGVGSVAAVECTVGE
jgi:PST family polysaccharide transporter